MPIQIGYCNGRNTTYNGFEYHKGSEINIAVTDFMLVLGHTWEIKDNTYRIEDAKVFFVEKGTAIEMYQTTLHLSPCRVSDIGFKDVVILPRGTNTPLNNGGTDEAAIGEERLLLQRNKWVIAHPDREPLINKGHILDCLERIRNFIIKKPRDRKTEYWTYYCTFGCVGNNFQKKYIM